MKSLRNIKLRTFAGNSVDLALGRNYNPLKKDISIQPSHHLTANFLRDYKTPYGLTQPSQNPFVYQDLPKKALC